MPQSLTLSQSLVSGGTLNPDKLSLDLQFATDKTIVARRGPTPVFTRGSNATYFGSNGLLQYTSGIQQPRFDHDPVGRTNYSKGFNFWASQAGGTFIANSTDIQSPNGTYDSIKATLLGGSSSQILNTPSTPIGTFTISCYLRGVNGGESVRLSTYNPVDGERNSAIQTLTTSWVRYSFTFTSTATNSSFVILTGGSLCSFYAWGAQMELGSIATSYIPTSSTAPITLRDCKGLLLEESRTNLLSQSNSFDLSWSAIQLNVTGTPAYQNAAISPDGTSNAEKLIGSIVTSSHQFRQDVTLASSTTYSLSCYFKAGEQIYASIAAYGLAIGNIDYSAFFDLQNGTVSGSLTGFTSSSITNIGNGWYRCVAVFTSVAGGGSLSVRIGGADANSVVYLGDGVSGIYVWGAQLEVGSFPTSYIPTTTGTSNRATDTISISGTNFSSSNFYNSSEGTALIKIKNCDTTSYPQLFSFYLSTSPIGNRIYVAGYNRMLYSEVGIINNGTAELGYVGSILNKSGNFSLSYKQNDAAYVRDGIVEKTDNTVIVPTSINALAFNETNGCISSFRYYKKRLPNTQIQTLTL